ncbi:MAG: FAD-dependent oxidoreductase [Ktedonobacteraceae bacterium]
MKREQKTGGAHYDVTIIGGGSGGLIAARLAMTLGAKVLLIDRERLGGDCLYYGCVPSKSLIHVARMAHQARNMADLGLASLAPQVEMGRVSEYIQGVIKRVETNEEALTEGVDVRFGRVEFQTATTLVLNGELIHSRNTIIATGSHPAIPPIEGLAETGYLTNEGVFDLTHLPTSLVVVGGGPIGVELSQAFARLGTQVTLIQGPERLLPREDPEVSEAITSVLQNDGVKILTNTRLIRARRQGTGRVVTVRCGAEEREIEADELLLAVGRQPNVAGLNLEAAGIKYDSKGIAVDAYLQTSASPILAVGDVLGGYLFTHVAAYQAGIAVRNALVTIAKKRVDYRVVPWCTFTDPEAARVGLTLAEAQREHTQVRVAKFPYAAIDRAQTEHATIGFIKLILAGKKDEIVGVHIVGVQGGELLGELALAMSKRLTLNHIVGTIHAYPTIASGLQQATFEAYLGSAGMHSNRKLVRMLLALRH